MPGHRSHPLDAPLAAMVKAMDDADTQMAQMSVGIGDFDSHELSPEEDELLFHNPALRYQDQVEPTTGLPYTNAQAAQKFLQDVGPEAYVAYVHDVVRRMDRRGKEGSPDGMGLERSVDMVSGGPAPSDTPV